METRKSLSPTPQGPEGPFFLPNQAVRRDIKEGKEGLPLTIQFNVKDFNNEGKAVPNAAVHVWHADALGVYSGYLALYPIEQHGISGEDHVEKTDDSTFLRGIQMTDNNGSAVFDTVFPGWYGVRTPHIHFRVSFQDKDCYTGEVYFKNSLADSVYNSTKPYCERFERETYKKKYNEEDPEFVTHFGEKTIATLEGDVNTALSGSLDVVVTL